MTIDTIDVEDDDDDRFDDYVRGPPLLLSNQIFFPESNQIKEMMMMTIGLEHFHHHHRNHGPKPEQVLFRLACFYPKKKIGPRIRAYWPIISN